MTVFSVSLFFISVQHTHLTKQNERRSDVQKHTSVSFHLNVTSKKIQMEAAEFDVLCCQHCVRCSLLSAAESFVLSHYTSNCRSFLSKLPSITSNMAERHFSCDGVCAVNEHRANYEYEAESGIHICVCMNRTGDVSLLVRACPLPK